MELAGSFAKRVGMRIFGVRFAGFIAVIGLTGLARGDWCVINKLEEMLSVACNDGELLAVLTEGIELVGEGSLELLASDVGKLGLCDQRLGLGANKLLLENNDSR